VNIVYVILAIIIVFVIVNKFNTRGIKHLNVETAQELAKDSTVTILDVRTPEEFAQGHLQKARLIPVGEIANRIGELSTLKDKQILVYCHSGIEAPPHARSFKKMDLRKSTILTGGLAHGRLVEIKS